MQFHGSEHMHTVMRVSFLKMFWLEGSCFTMLCQFLPCSKVNQQYVYIHPLPVGFPSHPGHHRAPSSLHSRFPSVICFTRLHEPFSVQTHIPSVLVSLHFLRTDEVLWGSVKILVPTPHFAFVLVWKHPLGPVCCGGIKSLCFSQALIFTFRWISTSRKPLGSE